MKPLTSWTLPWFIVLTALGMPATAQAQGLPQAVSDIHSEDPSVYLNYASILFYNGQQLLRNGKDEEAKAVFHNAEQALHVALQRSEADQDQLRRSLLRSQASFLLGELNFFVLGDKAKAKTFYEAALRECPQHAAAVAALARVLIPPQ